MYSDMSPDKLRKSINQTRESLNKTIQDLDTGYEDAKQARKVVENTRTILDDLDQQFTEQTGLTKKDIAFLFVAIALQCTRIYLVNNFTKIEKAGSINKKEKKLHEFEDKIFEHFNQDAHSTTAPFYAPLNQIISTHGVPYDATAFAEEKYNIFKGANHRFSTLAHDPIIGLVIGTANILTNTITYIEKPVFITTHHVMYTSDFKHPKIGTPTFNAEMLYHAVKRLDGDMESVVAALIKQVIHIGTDLYTPCGIQLPGANLVLSKRQTEALTRVVSTGDMLKIGASYKIAEFINLLISTLHQLTYDSLEGSSRNLYAVRTKKIILYSNMIATGSNVIWVGANMAAGKANAIKELDIAGLLIIIQQLLHNQEFIKQVKEEFIFGTYKKMLWNEI